MSARQTFQDLIIQQPSDFSRIPGYVAKIDHTKEVFEDVLSHHRFKHYSKCSLLACGTPYKDGYVLLWQSGAISNVGNCCAKKYLGAGFTDRLEKYQQEREMPRLMSRLQISKQQASGYRKQADSLRNNLQELAEKKRAFERLFPNVWSTLVKSFKENVYPVVIVRESYATIYNDQNEDTGRKRLQHEESKVGEIRGLEYLRKHALPILTTQVYEVLDQIEKVNFGSMSFKALYALSIETNSIDEGLAEATRLAKFGNAFFSKQTMLLINQLQGNSILEKEARTFNLTTLVACEQIVAKRESKKPLNRKERREIKFG